MLFTAFAHLSASAAVPASLSKRKFGRCASPKTECFQLYLSYKRSTGGGETTEYLLTGQMIFLIRLTDEVIKDAAAKESGEVRRDGIGGNAFYGH